MHEEGGSGVWGLDFERLRKIEMGGFLIVLPTLMKAFEDVEVVVSKGVDKLDTLVKVICERLGGENCKLNNFWLHYPN